MSQCNAISNESCVANPEGRVRVRIGLAPRAKKVVAVCSLGQGILVGNAVEPAFDLAVKRHQVLDIIQRSFADIIPSPGRM